MEEEEQASPHHCPFGFIHQHIISHTSYRTAQHTQHTHSTHTLAGVQVCYGSATGTAEAISQRLQSDLAEKSVDAKLVCLMDLPDYPTARWP